jgi:hypothetical protein
MGCGCAQRKQWLNERRPGLGDKAQRLIQIGLGVAVFAGLVWALKGDARG